MKHCLALLVAGMLLTACQDDTATSSVARDSAGSEAGDTATPTDTPTDTRATPEATPAPPDTEAITRSLEHADRPEEDRGRDALRHPDEIMAFAGIQPGMKVLDVFSASGYYVEILSRIVGPDGEVWAQNPPQFYERFGSADLDFRLADRRLPNVERQDRPMENLALPATYFDGVVAALVFHDLFWLTDDVPAVLAQLFDAMKPGAVMLITDHDAPEGTGASMAMDPEGKHRVEAAEVKRLMEAAGFEQVATSEVLRNPEDDRTQAFFEPAMRGKPTDRFVHLYRKPG